MVADQVLALVQGELETNQISLRNEMQGRPTEVFGDRIQLQQVLLNLIMNAIEAMSSETSRERNLMITSGIDDGIKVRITVEDTGGEIDPAHLDQIFDPFFTTKSNGMGLGLSICRSIIEAHGGRLSASPRSPFGTAFHLILPIAGAAQQLRSKPIRVSSAIERLRAVHACPLSPQICCKTRLLSRFNSWPRPDAALPFERVASSDVSALA